MVNTSFTAGSDGLTPRVIGCRIDYHSVVSSTMDVARDRARDGAPEGTTIVAKRQTAGRGRMRRAWLSSEGSLLLSVILRPEVAHLPLLIMLSSVAVVRTIRLVSGLNAGIKWPNDVLIGGKKVCGILIESSLRGKTVDHAVIGIGLNVNVDFAAYPEMAPVATSLMRESGGQVSLAETLKRLLAALDQLYGCLGDGDSLYREWRANLVTLGNRVRAKSGDTIEEGIAESVGKDASLSVRRDDGSLAIVHTGDVTLRDDYKNER